jgi:hypothetical protein
MERETEQPDSTDGPGNVSVDEPTAPALDDQDQDEFDKQAEKQEEA